MPSPGQTQKTAKRRVARRRQSSIPFVTGPRGPDRAPLGDRLASVAGWRPGQDFPAHLTASAELSLIEGVARTLSRQR